MGWRNAKGFGAGSLMTGTGRGRAGAQSTLGGGVGSMTKEKKVKK